MEKTFDFSAQQLILRKKQVFFSSSIFFDGKNICCRHPADFGRKKHLFLAFSNFFLENIKYFFLFSAEALLTLSVFCLAQALDSPYRLLPRYDFFALPWPALCLSHHILF
ncbi:MAG: hypothetical protein LBD28_07740 [Tannerellaceae bacterium]|nr:hypothetical protein [Tannerellaceae bacterium]